MTNYRKLLLAFFLITGINYSYAQTGNKPLTIGQSSTFFSKILNENRNINIYLPDNYKADDTTNYPVVYILDGGLEEDFLHITGIVQFSSQPWIARFPKSIVVGIENVNRRRDFTFAVTNTDFIEKEGFKKSSFPQYGKSANYIDFLEKELQPFISKNFKGSGQKTIIGESLAGLLTAEILLKRPYLFNNYIIISPSLWWGEQKLLTDAGKLLAQNLKKTVHVYVGVPAKEEDIKMYNEAEQFYQLLKKQANVSSTFDYMPEEKHATVIHQAVYNGLRKLGAQ